MAKIQISYVNRVFHHDFDPLSFKTQCLDLVSSPICLIRLRYVDGIVADMARHLGKMIEHPKSKSTKPQSAC